jgi:hypothetical protein
MHRDRHRPARIAGMNENVMASGNPIDEKPCLQKCTNNDPATDNRQGASSHS